MFQLNVLFASTCCLLGCLQPKQYLKQSNQMRLYYTKNKVKFVFCTRCKNCDFHLQVFSKERKTKKKYSVSLEASFVK